MKISRTKIVIGLIVILTLIIVFFGLAFHAMEIEDHYGDLQDFYYKSKSGDLMIFGDYEKIGVVDKTWKSIRVINSKNDTVDLYNWINDNRYKDGSNKLFRVKAKISTDELDKGIIIQKINRNELKEIMSII